MELEPRADAGIVAAELVVNEGPLFPVTPPKLTSQDHSATEKFSYTRRLCQCSVLPPSNAVLAHPVAGVPPLPTPAPNPAQLHHLPLPPPFSTFLPYFNRLRKWASHEYDTRPAPLLPSPGRTRTGSSPAYVRSTFSSDIPATTLS
ncbi:hypothetical protein EI94DRAFT_1793899 [Lactarius quietus]|nr:hypothetical protein EI94DRAFT_1793899 [Lactarius quietus]